MFQRKPEPRREDGLRAAGRLEGRENRLRVVVYHGCEGVEGPELRPLSVQRLVARPHLGDPCTESGQTLQGSFSAVSKPNFAKKY